jgi:translation initiation factor RLI1
MFVYGEKSKFMRKKRKMTLALTYSSMDQRSICLFLVTKQLSAEATDNELVAVLGPEAIGYSTVTNYLRQRHFPSTLRKTRDEPLHGIHWDFP